MTITEQLVEALREMFPLFSPGPDRPGCFCIHCEVSRKARAALAAYEASKATDAEVAKRDEHLRKMRRSADHDSTG